MAQDAVAYRSRLPTHTSLLFPLGTLGAGGTASPFRTTSSSNYAVHSPTVLIAGAPPGRLERIPL